MADKRIRVIAAFAGVGKSAFAERNPEKFTDFALMPYKYYLDPDREFDESGKANPENVMREDWPRNYAEAIQRALAESDKTLIIPSDSSVLRLLREKDIPYLLVYPAREAKEVYRKRFIARGNTEDFLSVFIDGWDRFMDSLENDQYGDHRVLRPEQYLSDAISADRSYYR